MAGAAGTDALIEESGGPVVYHLEGGGALRRGLSREGLAAALRDTRGQLWVDIDSRREDEWALLHELFGFHPLAVEDTRSPDCRVKLEEYEGYVFIVVRGIRFATWTPAPYDIETFNLYLFLGRNFLVSVRGEPSRAVNTVAARLGAAPDLLARGVEHVAYMLVDTLVDLYFPLLDEIDAFVDELEDSVFRNPGPETMERLFDLKRSMLALRRHLAPMREVMAALANRPSAYLRAETQVYFRDVYDHVVRQLESIETYRDVVTGAMDGYLSMLSNRMNEVIKALSVIATVVLPPTLVASIYGMNFEYMPALGNPFGFWLALLLMAGISATFVVILYWKGWL